MTTTATVQNQNWYLKGEPFVYDSSVKELFGKCLKLDSSGNKLVVGSNDRATVYSFANFNWNQLGNSLSHRSMSDGRNTILSSDGTLLLCSITRRLENPDNANVWSFGLNTTNNEWDYTYPIIEAPYEIYFGFSLALSTDQTVLALGTPKFRNSFVNIYKLINNTWTFVQTLFWNTTKLGTQYGYSVSLNADGTRLAVGTGPRFNTVFIYQYISDQWIEMGSTVVGSSVSFNNNGDMLVTSNENTGFVYSYRYSSSSGNWEQATSVITNVEQNILFGFCVCLSGDGTTLAIGAPGKINTGLHGFVSVYTLETNDWVLKGTTLEDENRSTQFGFSIDLSTDGNVLAVGAQRANNNVGLASVYLFGDVPLPYPPSNLHATITGETTATLTYTADPSGNTSMYTAKIAGTSSSIEYNSVNAATTIFITGLVPNNSYTFYVVSSNLYGQSTQSTNSNTIVLSQLPEPPQHVQAVATGYSSATITMASSTNATLYKANTTINGRPVSFTSVNNTPIIYATNLQAGNIYTFEVFAENQYGTSQNSTLSNTIHLPKLTSIIYNTSTTSNQKMLKKVARGCKSQTSNPKWGCMLNL